MSASPRPVAGTRPAFDALVDAALTQRRRALETALHDGVDLQALVRYAAGTARPAERRTAEAAVARNRFAADAVAALAGREGGLGAELLAATKAGPVDAAKLVGRAVLAEAGRPDLAESRAEASDPLLAGAAALSRSQPQQALEALGRVARPTPLGALARRVAEAGPDTDLALGELLDWLCTEDRR